jgi:hypothetical protein
MIDAKLEHYSGRNSEYTSFGEIMKYERAAVLTLGLVYYGRF